MSYYYSKMRKLFRDINSSVYDQKDFGYIVSIIPFFMKSKELNKDKKSEYVGQLNQKIDLEVTVKKIKDFHGTYGLTYIVSMEDVDGNDLIWFANPNEITPKITSALQNKTSINITGTVSKHDISRFTNLPETSLKKVTVNS